MRFLEQDLTQGYNYQLLLLMVNIYLWASFLAIS